MALRFSMRVEQVLYPFVLVADNFYLEKVLDGIRIIYQNI